MNKKICHSFVKSKKTLLASINCLFFMKIVRFRHNRQNPEKKQFFNDLAWKPEVDFFSLSVNFYPADK